MNIKNNFLYRLDAISPISTEQKHINISAVYEFIFIFLFLIILKPFYFSYVSILSAIKITFFTTFIFIGFSWLYYSYTAKKINFATWTYLEDIKRFFIALLLSTLIYFFYSYFAIEYFYKEELIKNNWDFERNTFVELIPYILFIGIIAYILLKFVDYMKFTNHSNLEAYKNSQENKLEKIVFDKNLNPDYLIQKEKPDKKIIKLYGKNKDEEVIMNLNDFLYLESFGHYIKVYSKINEKPILIY